VPVSISNAQGPLYSVRDLGPLSNLAGRSDAGPRGINSLARVAGANAVGGFYEAMLWTNAAWQDLGTLGGNESLAAGLNDLDQLVGYAQIATGQTNGFIWIPNGTGSVTNSQMKSLGTLGGAVSEAYAVNNAGQITGYSDVPGHPSTQQHAFLFSSGTMLDIGSTLNGLPNSFGYAINSAGHIGGAAYDVAYSAPHAFFFDGTNASDLGVFGGLGASFSAINNSDQLAGYLTTTSSFDHAFGYISNRLVDLGTLGGNYSYGLGINNCNVIVGGSFTDPKDSIYHAFEWFGGTMVDLNSRLDASGAGWTLTEARGINDAGQITGVGALGGVPHGFLLDPTANINVPPPLFSTIQLVGSNLVFQFSTKPGFQYILQTNPSLSGLSWSNSGGPLSASGDSSVLTNPLPTEPHLFYRIKAF
jgi:probable HAF family extracellular repeat protein